MPSTPEAASKNDVTVKSAAYDECRQNALKNRKENDWFGHEAGSTKTSGLRPSSSSSARTHNRTEESEQWFRYDVNGTSLPAAKPETTCRGAKGRVHTDQQDWYKHGDSVPDPPSLEKRSKSKSRRSACAETRHKARDSNDWFRHDRKAGACGVADESKPAKKPIKIASPTALWVVYPDGEGATSYSTPRPKSRLTVPEADDYCRRDKLGSSADWFSHEHPLDDVASPGSTPGFRTRGTPEGGEIANRLKAESEDWFSHDGSQNYVSPLPVVKGNSPLTRELMERSRGHEMKHIFHVEDNLRTTWTAPPPLTATPPSPKVHEQASLGQSPTRSDTVGLENGLEMTDSVVKNGH